MNSEDPINVKYILKQTLKGRQYGVDIKSKRLVAGKWRQLYLNNNKIFLINKYKIKVLFHLTVYCGCKGKCMTYF